MSNRHAGTPFTDDDAAIARALEDVAVPALLCSLAHATGDLSWVRDRRLPTLPSSNDFQCGISEDEQAEIRRLAVAAIAAYRDAGCRPVDLSVEQLRELMAFIGGAPLPERLDAMLFEDMQFDGVDPRSVEWGDEVPEAVRHDSPVVVIGCGESGILAGLRLSQAGLPFTILDKNEGPGGTWWENRYPGARVDVGSHQYCYAFEPSDHWSHYYCLQPELRDYFARIVDQHGLTPHIRYGTTVNRLEWDEPAARWRITVEDRTGGTEVIEARFVISAVGSLNLPNLPSIPGTETFEGPSFHSARWPKELDLTGKRFALIGAGASGFQIAPTIAPEVAQLDIYQRTPQWMFPNPYYRRPVPPGDLWAMKHLPFYTRWFRFMMGYTGIALGTAPFTMDPDYDGNDRAISAANAARREVLEQWIRSQLGDRDDLMTQSIPDYPSSGKRMLQDDGFWLRSLCRENVELIRTGIERIVPDGVVTTDGVHRPADVICYATGFRHNDFLAPMEVIGRGGVSLRDQWGDEPTAYLGVTMPNFPNLFCLYGPGTNLAHSSSLFFHSEFQTSHAMDVIHEVLASGATTAEVRVAVHDTYAADHQREISRLVWAHPSIRHSHYKNPAGKVYTLSPWPIDQYWEMTRQIDPEAYEIRR